VPTYATKHHLPQKQGGAMYNAPVNKLEFSSATSNVSRNGAAKPELTESCTVRSPTLFLSHARFSAHVETL